MRKFLLLIAVFAALFCKTAFAEADGARSACVMDALTGELIFEKNAYERLPMASTTKIMTAVVALENSEADEVVEISKNAETQEGSRAYVTAGEKIYMGDLLYGLMLNSGNDAAVAVAEHIAGSVGEFSDMMNAKARAIGANDTSFANPSGLEDEAHFTTAHDLALITRYALKKPDFSEIVSTKSILKHPINSDKELWFINHNKLLKSYEGCIGVKTGYTKTAGRCLVSAASRGGMTFIAVTLNDGNDWKEHKEMLDFAFDKYSPRELIKKGEPVKTVSSDGKDYSLVTADSFVMPFDEGKMKEINISPHITDNTAIPINAGEKVGYMEITYGGEKIGSVDIISESDIYGGADFKLKNSFLSVFKRVLRLLCI